MSHKIFTCTHRVSYAECTVGNHVYHSRFLDILERARGEFLRSLNQSLAKLQEEGSGFPMVACEMEFKAMARYDDLLTIDLWLSALSGARFSCAGRIRDARGATVLNAVTHLACATLAGKPRRMPVQLVAALRDYLATTGPDSAPG